MSLSVRTCVVLVFGQYRGPMFEFVSVFIDEIIEDSSSSREFDRLEFVDLIDHVISQQIQTVL